MIGEYTFYLTTDKGVRIASLGGESGLKPLWFTATHEISRIGHFAMGLPLSFDKNLLAVDRMVQIWRKASGGTNKLFRAYFIRKWHFKTDENGYKSITIEGPDTMDLLRRRVIAAYDGSDEAEISALECDSAIAELARDTYDNTIEPTPTAGTRAWSLFSVKSSAGTGPTLTRQFAFERYLTPNGGGLFAELSKASREAGDEIFFDIIVNTLSSTGITLEFRTYHNQPGQDISGNVTLSLENGGLRAAELTYDYLDEVNYVYAGGKGRDDGRNVQQVYDATRYSASVWNRCEAYQNSYEEEDNGVREQGRQRLVDGKPTIRFIGEAGDSQAARYGVDWDFGDRVAVEYENISFDTIIRAVTLAVNSEGKETIAARLDYEA